MPFEALTPELRIALDIDVLVGAYPDRDGPSGDACTVLATMAAAGVQTAAVASLRAALFDVQSGNDEVLAAADAGDVVPIGTVDLRDPLGAERELDRLVSLGVRAVRLFPDEQHIEPGFPSVRAIANRATALGLPVLTGGDVRRFWQPLSGLGAVVVFLDTHFYHLGDFLVVARDEPGFHTSTRLLNSPDALETVAAQVGVGRMLFGSRIPHAEPMAPRLRLARCGLAPHDVAAIAGGNARRLLGLQP